MISFFFLVGQLLLTVIGVSIVVISWFLWVLLTLEQLRDFREERLYREKEKAEEELMSNIMSKAPDYVVFDDSEIIEGRIVDE